MGRYRRRYELRLQEKEEWESILKAVDIYELDNLPKNLDKIPEGKEVLWEKEKKDRSDPTDNYRKRDKAWILEVTAVFPNPKNTIKILVAGKDKVFALFPRDVYVEGWQSLEVPSVWSDETSDVFDSIKEGTFLVVKEGYYRSIKEVAFISNEKDIEKIKQILNILNKIAELRSKYSDFAWKQEMHTLKSYGTVSPFEVLIKESEFLQILRKFRWMERKAQWDLMNTVKSSLSFKITKKELKVKAKGLDGKTYSLNCPLSKENQLGWKQSSIFEINYWIPFVYRKPTDRFLILTPQQKTSALFSKFLDTLYRLPESNIELRVNRRKVLVERKKTQKGAVYQYLNGNLVAGKEIRQKLADYFLQGKPLVPPSFPSTTGVKRPKRTISTEAQKLISLGLNGEIRDLEGEFPFHLNVIYKAKERKWYLEIGGKEFHIKGGYSALARVKSAIEGNALVTRKDRSNLDRRSTRLVMARLGDLIGEKEALWVILKVKKMGALMKVMKGEE